MVSVKIFAPTRKKRGGANDDAFAVLTSGFGA
jgi:hypothetical protein